MGEQYQVFIPNWRPINLNAMFAKHWSKRNKAKKEDAKTIFAAIHEAKIPKATSKRHVGLHIALTGSQKEADPDAYWKSLLDGLVKCGALIDDSDTYCSFGMPTYERGTAEQAGTRITLTDIN